MARVTITDAVKQGFASRPTIYRAIKDGRLTTHQDGRRRLVDVADLVQVFGEPKPASAPPPAARDIEADHLRDENARLQAELSAARAEIDHVRTQAEDERARLYGIMEATQMALADNSRGAGEKSTLWKRLFGKG